MNTPSPAPGVVYLVGAGPGDPGLLTRRGAEVLARAQVVVYDGLVNRVLLDLAPPTAERIYAGKKRAEAGAPLTQQRINELLVEHGLAGKRVVRLKGGDPFVFGRGAEECMALRAAGVRFEIVPGVTSATAVPAYAGIPLTARDRASTVAFATGHEAAGKPESGLDWEALARASTLVLFMAVHNADECADRLIAAGRDPATPAAAIYWGTTASQRTVTAPLSQLAAAMHDSGIHPPALLVVGEVVDLRAALSWYEDRPLAGVRVLVTRDPDRAEDFLDALAALGAEPVTLPVTRIAPPANPGPLISALDHIAEVDWLLLTSANTVAQVWDELARRRLDGRALARARIACVGPATAAALAERGLYADVVPARGDAVGVARAVIDASGDGVAGARVLIPQAEGGRPEAAEILRAAGAEVEVVAAYRSEPTPVDDPAVVHGLRRLRERDLDAVVFFAPSQVRALLDLAGPDAAELIRACSIVASIGATTARALEAAGIPVQVVASRPDVGILAAQIADHHHRSKEDA